MRPKPLAPLISLAALALGTLCSLLSPTPLLAASRVEDGLALVPADAASVGVIRFADLRTNPLSARLFSETDRITVDGDAAHGRSGGAAPGAGRRPGGSGARHGSEARRPAGGGASGGLPCPAARARPVVARR